MSYLRKRPALLALAGILLAVQAISWSGQSASPSPAAGAPSVIVIRHARLIDGTDAIYEIMNENPGPVLVSPILI